LTGRSSDLRVNPFGCELHDDEATMRPFEVFEVRESYSQGRGGIGSAARGEHRGRRRADCRCHQFDGQRSRARRWLIAVPRTAGHVEPPGTVRVASQDDEVTNPLAFDEIEHAVALTGITVPLVRVRRARAWQR